jgi:uncharacterized protein
MEEAAGRAPPAAARSDEQNWALFTHLAALSALFTGGVGAVLGPLVVWLLAKEKHPSIDAHGKEAMNFNLTFAIAWFTLFVFAMLFMVGAPLLFLHDPFFFPFMAMPLLILAFAALGITWIVLVVTGSVKAASGELYRYPFAIRFIR